MIEKDIAFEHVLVVMIKHTDEENVEVTDWHASAFHLWMVMCQIPEISLQVLPIKEHEKDLKDSALVLIATWHLDLEEENAELCERNTSLELYICQEGWRDPFLNTT